MLQQIFYYLDVESKSSTVNIILKCTKCYIQVVSIYVTYIVIASRFLKHNVAVHRINFYSKGSIDMTIKNVYVVFTEYQLLQAVNIASGIKNLKEHQNIIYIVRGGRRMLAIKKEKNYDVANIVFKILDNVAPKHLENVLLKEKPNHFFLFQNTTAITVHLGQMMFNQGAEISLGPDGYGAYGYFNKRFKMLSVLRESARNNIYLLKNKLFSGKIHVFNYKYGVKKFITNIWVTHPDQYIHEGTNKICLLKLPELDTACIEIMKNLFSFNVDFPTNDCIYFFNQPLWDVLLDLELNFLLEVQKQFPDKKIVLKLHPLTTTEMKNRYKSLSGITVIDKDFPAEILILSLKNCILYSGYSTVLMTENDTCNYYFNYPVFKKIGHKVMNQLEIYPLDHIKMVESSSEMEFPV